MLLDDPQRLFYFLLALLIGLTFHEAAHAVSALWLGDDTAQKLGRVTLNPIAHLDPVGTIFLIIVAIAGMGIGWAKPVPVNPRYLRPNPQLGMALVAVAGPISNILIAIVAVFLQPLAAEWSADLLRFVRVLILVNISLAVFNMIPIPPLDGFNFVVGFLPERQAYTLRSFAMYGPLVLLALVMLAPGFLNQIMTPAISTILRTLLTLSGTTRLFFSV